MPSYSSNIIIVNSRNKIIKKSFKLHIDLPTYRMLYCTFVRPLLEFAAPVWNPHHQKDIDKLEKVQRRATKLAPGLKKFEYAKRLKILDLTSLFERRIRGDLIQMYKICKGFDKVIWYSPFKFNNNESNTRGHTFKFNRDNFNINFRYNFFINRISNAWNNLPTEILNTNNVDIFKEKLDGIFKRYGTYNLNSTGKLEFQRSL